MSNQIYYINVDLILWHTGSVFVACPALLYAKLARTSSGDAQLRHVGSGAETSEQTTLRMMTLLRAHVHYIKKKR